MIKAVLFDMDGVLLDTEKYLTKYIREAAEEFGYRMDREVSFMLRSYAYQFAAPRLKEIYGEEFDYLAVRRRRQEMMKSHIEKYGLETKPGVEETVKALRKRGLRTAVVTATDEQRAGEYLGKVGFLGLFDEVVCASMVERGKPYPDVYLYACRKLGLLPEECLAVEDSPNGVQSAWSAGCRVVMVPDLTEPDEETRSRTAGVCRELKEIPGWLEKEREADGTV